MVTNYQRGYVAEQKVIRWLRTWGHLYQMRSAGSKGAFDIISWDGKWLYFIQVKRGRGPHLTDYHHMYCDSLRYELGCWPTVILWVRVDPRKEPRVWRFRANGWEETTCDELTGNS